MARTKVDEIQVDALIRRRSQLSQDIAALVTLSVTLPEMQRELADIELKLKEIDPTIQSLDEEISASEAEIK